MRGHVSSWLIALLVGLLSLQADADDDAIGP